VHLNALRHASFVEIRACRSSMEVPASAVDRFCNLALRYMQPHDAQSTVRQQASLPSSSLREPHKLSQGLYTTCPEVVNMPRGASQGRGARSPVAVEDPPCTAMKGVCAKNPVALEAMKAAVSLSRLHESCMTDNSRGAFSCPGSESCGTNRNVDPGRAISGMTGAVTHFCYSVHQPC
jgi:hypothetical protein